MTDKKGKRAVIISNIKSDSIEQAIFILKSPKQQAASEISCGIVAEAQEIINSYINTIEKREQMFLRKKSIPKRIIAACMAIFAVCAAVISIALKG